MMKQLTALVMGVCISILGAQGQTTQSSTRPGVTRSPEVHDDGTVTFRLVAPRANDLSIVPEIDYKRLPMNKDERGVWSATLGPWPANVYSYHFVVDGVPLPDPQNGVPKGPAPLSSLVEVGGDASFCALRAVPHGQVHIVRYRSKSLDCERRMYVYTPPGYDQHPQERYPVLYLLHGSGDDDSGWTQVGRAELILDNLLAEGKARPMIMVMPEGKAQHADPAKRDANKWREIMLAFADDLLGDIVPMVDSQYRTQASADGRALAGLSMGGIQTLLIGLSHPEVFSQLAAFSGTPALKISPSDDDVMAKLLSDPAKIKSNVKLLWIGCGKSDSLFGSSEKFASRLDELGIRHIWRPTEGYHHWPLWRNYLCEILPMLFK